MPFSQPLIWIDMEMTGLDPERDRVLEIAVILTDGSLSQEEEGPDLVVHQDAAVLRAMDEWNTEHHGASGLVDRVLASHLNEKDAEGEVLAWLQERCGQNQVPLAGNSVHQDRAFLRRWMPRLHNFLHYRNVDVSTLKELLRRWAPDVVAQAPEKQSSHRALDDIRESIAELRYYRTHLLPDFEPAEEGESSPDAGTV
jgi:oligoribonuclease